MEINVKKMKAMVISRKEERKRDIKKN